MRKFGADLAAVNSLEKRPYVAQPHALVTGARETARKKFRVHVGLGETQVFELQDARHRPGHQTQRIDIGDLVAAQTIDLDEARNGRLLFARRRRPGRA